MSSLTKNMVRFFPPIQPKEATRTEMGYFGCLPPEIQERIFSCLSVFYMVQLAPTCTTWLSLIEKNLSQRYLSPPASIEVVARRFLQDGDLLSSRRFAKAKERSESTFIAINQNIFQKACATKDLANILGSLAAVRKIYCSTDLVQVSLQLAEHNRRLIFAKWLTNLKPYEYSNLTNFFFVLCTTLLDRDQVLAEEVINMVLSKNCHLLENREYIANKKAEEPEFVVIDDTWIIVENLLQKGLDDLAAHIFYRIPTLIPIPKLACWIDINKKFSPLALFKVAAHPYFAEHHTAAALLDRFKPEKLVESQLLNAVEKWVREKGPYLSSTEKVQSIVHISNYFKIKNLKGVEAFEALLLKLERKAFIKAAMLLDVTKEQNWAPVVLSQPDCGLELEHNSSLWNNIVRLVRQKLYKEARLLIDEVIIKYDDDVTYLFCQQLKANLEDVEVSMRSIESRVADLQQEKIRHNHAELNEIEQCAEDDYFAISESELSLGSEGEEELEGCEIELSEDEEGPETSGF